MAVKIKRVAWAADVVARAILQDLLDVALESAPPRALDTSIGRLTRFDEEDEATEPGLREAARQLATEIRARGWTRFATLPSISGHVDQYWLTDTDTGFKLRAILSYDVQRGQRVIRFDVLGGTA